MGFFVENNSDYKKPRTRIDKLLPEPYQSETITSIMENSVNRFLTKNETVYVDGYVGLNNPNAINSRQIIEDDIIAQANQLQPIVAAILGSEKRYMGWTDVINELEEQGVDLSTFPEWGKTEKYNWVPPVDIDKLIHFRDYFWVSSDANSVPEYITIRSSLNDANIQVSSLNRIIAQFGDTFQIESLHQANDPVLFSISLIDVVTNSVTVVGDATSEISENTFITIKNTTDNNTQVKVVAAPVYDGVSTRLVVESDVLVANAAQGQVCVTTYDGIVISGDLTSLFEDEFLFFVNESDNIELNDSFLVSSGSELSDNTTIVYLESNITDSRIVGNISLSEQLAIAQSAVACETSEVPGYDLGLLDDNASLTDIASDCKPKASATELQWSSNNNWVHRSDVQSFASARQANYPIIEFFQGLDINEYLQIVHKWRYRSTTSSTFIDSSIVPALIELKPLTQFVLSNQNSTITFDESYGNLTDEFPKGYQFVDDVDTILTVSNTTFKFDVGNKQWNTVVELDGSATSATSLFQPLVTSHGDTWFGYETQWVYGGISGENPVPNKARNFLNDIAEDAPLVPFEDNGVIQYQYQTSRYAQRYIINDSSNTTFEFANSNLTNVALAGQTDIRVYLNSIRLHGGYRELTDQLTNKFVVGIELESTVNASTMDEILIEVAPVVLTDHGRTNLQLRTIEDDITYRNLPLDQRTELTSIVEFRLFEQIKSELNQYPQFTIFNANGAPANVASSIFQFKTDRTLPVLPELRLRAVVDALTQDYTFEQSLLNSDDELLAYSNTCLLYTSPSPRDRG